MPEAEQQQAVEAATATAVTEKAPQPDGDDVESISDYQKLKDEPIMKAMSALLRTVHLETGA